MSTCPNCKFSTAKQLTKHEAETLIYMLKGMSPKEIGAYLFKSPKTINTFWQRAKKKLGVHNLFGVYHKWVTYKMLEVPDMEETPEFRAGYSQALADVLDPDLSIFTKGAQ
jgi:DNA-binding CsgD family transcriptional regulator